jgi:hypothetical protein
MHMVPPFSKCFLTILNHAMMVVADREVSKWSRKFIFPTNVSSIPSTRVDASGSGDVINLIRGMASSRTFTLDLFVWGNALMYSSNSGRSFRVIRSFSVTI